MNQRTTFLVIFCILFVLASSDAFAGIGTDIQKANTVILKTGSWQPLPEQTDQALVAVQGFLETLDMKDGFSKEEIKKIRQHSKQYRVQFIGIISKGRKRIFCNFFPGAKVLSNGEDEFDYWKSRRIDLDDGGFWFWHIEYDPSTGKCLNFNSNGYA